MAVSQLEVYFSTIKTGRNLSISSCKKIVTVLESAGLDVYAFQDDKLIVDNFVDHETAQQFEDVVFEILAQE